MKKGGCFIGCLAMLTTAVFLALMVIYYGNSLLNLINRFGEETLLPEEEIQAIERETDAPEDFPEDATVIGDEESRVLPQDKAEPLESSDNIINILLIGQDRRGGESRQRSDTMILCTINKKNKTLVMTSFLRDLYVRIPTWEGRSFQDNRLNVCYAFGGMGLLDQCLEDNFGIQVDHNVEVDFSGFEDIINLFGGVEVDLTAAEAAFLGQGLAEGVNHLDAKQALEFVRIRKLDSDFGRTERQRRLLKGMVASARKMNADQLGDLVYEILPMITTDMTNDEITACMLELLPLLPELSVSTQYIPAAGTYQNASIRGMAVLLPDLEKNIAVLKETLR